MSCCAHCRAAEHQFGPAMARRDLARYHRKGPDTTTRHLLALLRDAGFRDGTLLDIGAGVGVIHHELLGQGTVRVTHVEASPAYLAEARAEVDRRGHGDRVRFVKGDFVDLAATVEVADLVTLDRVVCCYPDYAALVSRSAARAGRYYGLSLPRDRWYVRAVVALQNLVRRITGSAFRTFVHPTAAVHALLTDAGFERHGQRATIAWEAAVYRRAAPPGP